MKLSGLTPVIANALKHALPPALFFLVGANLIKALVRLSYAPETLTAWETLALSITAVVTAKAVILLDLLPFMKKLDDQPLIQPALFRATLYFTAISILRALEQLIRTRLNVDAIVTSIRLEQWNHFIALNGWIFTLCFLYAFTQQINNAFAGKLFKVVFISRGKTQRPAKIGSQEVAASHT